MNAATTSFFSDTDMTEPVSSNEESRFSNLGRDSSSSESSGTGLKDKTALLIKLIVVE